MNGQGVKLSKLNWRLMCAVCIFVVIIHTKDITLYYWGKKGFEYIGHLNTLIAEQQFLRLNLGLI